MFCTFSFLYDCLTISHILCRYPVKVTCKGDAPNPYQSLPKPRPANMEMSLLSWLALLTFYMLYVLLGGCMFNAIECQEEYRDQEAEESREIKLIIVDLLAEVLLYDKESSNFTSVIRRIRQLSTSNANFNGGNQVTIKVFQDDD